jgi:murein DD-endopeptidase MepM/ murein hydrolase activator NlpD
VKRILFVFLIIFLFFIVPTLHFIDKKYFLCPIEYKKYIIIRSDDLGSGEFGAPRAGGRKHEGIDLYAQIGTEVRAVRFGRVVEARYHRNLGNYVELSHPDNLVTIYGHLQEISVKPGQWVAQGEVIGRTGKTGNANHPKIMPHVHFELRKNNLPINPLNWLEGQREVNND